MPFFYSHIRLFNQSKAFFCLLIISILSFSCSTNPSQKEVVFRNYDRINNKEKIIGKEEAPAKTIKKRVSIPFKEVKSAELPDFSKYKNIRQKKLAFFRFLYPMVVKENKKVLKQRAFILAQGERLKSNKPLSDESIKRLSTYLIQYRCQDSSLSDSNTFKELLKHIDIIPTNLVLVQAAIESSWGSSYFARLGNNLFGQWCFTPGCGLVPRSRAKDKTHEVAKFDTLAESIRSYMLFLNSHPFFDLLRIEREKARLNNQKPDAYSMAKGLTAYSARGKAYVRELQNMLRTNKDLFNSLIKP